MFEERERVYLVMEMLPMDFFDAISGKPRFTEEKWYGVCHSLASALVYLHDLGIVHRDMKPENILCNESLSVVKLTDFGLARILLPDMHLNLDAGTAAYKAPEVINSKGYGSEADIWGVGVIMYLVLAGRWPFDGPKQVEHILRKDPSFEGESWKTRSKECVDLVKRLLHKRPSRRPTAADILNCDWMKTMNSKSSKLLDSSSPFMLPPSATVIPECKRKGSSEFVSDDFMKKNDEVTIAAQRMSSINILCSSSSSSSSSPRRNVSSGDSRRNGSISAKRESTVQNTSEIGDVMVRRRASSSPKCREIKKNQKKFFPSEEEEEIEEMKKKNVAAVEGYRRASRSFETPPNSPVKD